MIYFQPPCLSVTSACFLVTQSLVWQVVPQAVCSRYGLAVGAHSAWFVRLLMLICWPIAFPISKVLDAVLGHEETVLPLC